MDDEWAQKLVSCPYCRNTITAPAQSTLPEPSAIPSATGLAQPETTPTPGVPRYATVPTPPTTNVLAKVAFALACLVVILCVLCWSVAYANREALAPLLQPDPGATFAEQLRAGREYAESVDPAEAAPLMVISLLMWSAGLVWVAALVCSIISMTRPVQRNWAIGALVLTCASPFLFCCGGTLFSLP